MLFTEQHISDLIRRYCQSEAQERHEAFRALYDACKRLVFASAARVAPNHASAEDLSQEIWLKLLRSVCSFRGESSFGAWLKRVALRAWLDMRKTPAERTQRELCRESLNQYFSVSQTESGVQELFVADDAHNANPGALAEADDMQMHIENALQRLTPSEANVFRARHFQDMPFKEIAAELGVSEGTVKTLHFRAMKKLQTLLKSVYEHSTLTK